MMRPDEFDDFITPDCLDLQAAERFNTAPAACVRNSR